MMIHFKALKHVLTVYELWKIFLLYLGNLTSISNHHIIYIMLVCTRMSVFLECLINFIIRSMQIDNHSWIQKGLSDAYI